MSRMQIVARGVLQGLFVYGAGVLLRFSPLIPEPRDKSAFRIIASIVMVAGVLWVLFRVVNSIGLVRGLVDSEDKLSPNEQRKWAVVTVRMSCIFWGLVLLVGSNWEVADAVTRAIQFLPRARDWFTTLFNSWDVAGFGHLLIPLVHLLRLLFVAMVVYLIMGAPQYVRWRAQAIVKEGNLSNSERSDDE